MLVLLVMLISVQEQPLSPTASTVVLENTALTQLKSLFMEPTVLLVLITTLVRVLLFVRSVLPVTTVLSLPILLDS